jgi:hypothetical protein
MITALRIVRYADADHLDNQLAMVTMVDAVADQVAKLREVHDQTLKPDRVPNDDHGDAAAEQALARHDAEVREAAEERRREKDAEDTAVKMAAIIPNMDAKRIGPDLRRGLIGPLQALLHDIAGAEQMERARCERAEAAAAARQGGL